MVHALHVLPAHRRQGAATLILRAAAKWAAGHGAEVLSLIVTQGNHAANPLYAAAWNDPGRPLPLPRAP